MLKAEESKHHLWKVMALVVAFLVWRAVLEERTQTLPFEVPITFERLNPSLAMVGDRFPRVTVSVEAAELVMKDLKASDIEPRIDLGEFRAGPAFVRFHPEQIRVPYGVKVVEIFPPSMTLTLERELNALVPIEPEILGVAALGYELKRAEAKPDRVQIEGPDSAVHAVEIAKTETINVEGARASFKREVWVVVDRSDVAIVSPVKVLVAVIIDEVTDTRTIEQVPIGVTAAAFVSRLKPTATDITVEGPRSQVSLLEAHDIEAYVDLETLEPAKRSYQLPIKINFRPTRAHDRVRVKSLSRETVKVRILNERLPETSNSGT